MGAQRKSDALLASDATPMKKDHGNGFVGLPVHMCFLLYCRLVLYSTVLYCSSLPRSLPPAEADPHSAPAARGLGSAGPTCAVESLKKSHANIRYPTKARRACTFSDFSPTQV